MRIRLFSKILTPLVLAALSGCMMENVNYKAKPATSIDPKLATSEYWFARPAVEKIVANNYDKLWNACEATANDVGFALDRFDYRTGFLETKPLVSRQFFELWRGDIVDFKSQVDSDTTTHRRTAQFKIRHRADGKYECEVKVVVEHYSMTERRITAVYQYRDAFSTHRQYETLTNDDGTPLRPEYWYAERRDELLEHSLAARVREYLSGERSFKRVIVDAQ